MISDSAKNDLQEYCQKYNISLPTYAHETQGPDHKKSFRSRVTVNGKQFTSMWMETKKDSEKAAAYEALSALTTPGLRLTYPSSSSSSSSTYSNPYLDRLFSQHLSKSKLRTFNIPSSIVSTSNTLSITSSSSSSSSSSSFSFSQTLSELKKIEEDIVIEPTLTIKLNPTTQKYDYGKIEYFDPAVKSIVDIEVANEVSFNTEDKMKQYLRMLMKEKLEDSYSIQPYHNASSRPAPSFTSYRMKPKRPINTDPIIFPPKGQKTLPQTKSTPRGYQIEMYNNIMERNSICCLATGLGKTLISCMAISEMKRLNPTKKALFLVDRIPLVTQQSQVIREETGLEVVGLHGDSSTLILDSKHDVLVIICALFINLIQKGECNLSDYAIIVVDEAHHIVKDHPFAVLLREYYSKLDKPLQPRIMGLTASPAGKADFFSTLLSLKVMSRISNSRIVTPLPESVQEIKKYQNQKDIRIEELSINKNESFMIVLISKLTQFIRERFQVRITLPKEFDEILNSTKIKNKQDQYEDQDIENDPLDDADEYISTSSGGSNTPFHSFINHLIEKCMDFIKYGGYLDESTNTLSPYNHATRVNVKEYCIRLVNQVKFLKEDMKKEIIFQIQSISHQSDNENTTDLCKLDKALEILEEYNNRYKNGISKQLVVTTTNTSTTATGGFRAIVFVKTRESAHHLGQILNLLSKKNARYSFIKCVTVVGHGSNTDNGMSTSKQKEVVELFRSGKANVVVTTNVLEEGLDVPECNLVIRIDAPSTVTALIQSRGRARHKNSEFVAIIKTVEGHSYRRFLMHEQLLLDTIEFLRTGEVPASLMDSISNTYYFKKEIEEMVQKCKVAEFDLGYEIKTDSVGNVYVPSFKSTLYFLSGHYSTTTTSKSKKEAMELVCREALESFSIYRILANL